MPQTQPQPTLNPQDPVGEPSDPMMEIFESLQRLSALFGGSPPTPEEDVVTQEVAELAPPPVAQEIPPQDETNAEARLRAARSALENNPFAGRTA